MSRDFARHLRKNMTDTERFVWYRLRKRQLGNFRFRRQFPIGPYVIDFVCLEARLILELDGSQHAEQIEYDQRRTEWLEAQGFRLLRFWNIDVLKEWDTVVEMIGRALREPPYPGPAR